MLIGIMASSPWLTSNSRSSASSSGFRLVSSDLIFYCLLFFGFLSCLSASGRCSIWSRISFVAASHSSKFFSFGGFLCSISFIWRFVFMLLHRISLFDSGFFFSFGYHGYFQGLSSASFLFLLLYCCFFFTDASSFVPFRFLAIGIGISFLANHRNWHSFTCYWM